MLIINNNLFIFYKVECCTKTEKKLKLKKNQTFLLNSTTPPHVQSTTQQFENASINKWSTTTYPQQSSEHPETDNTPINDNDDARFVPILLGIFIPLCIFSLLFCYYKRKSKLFFFRLVIQWPKFTII